MYIGAMLIINIRLLINCEINNYNNIKICIMLYPPPKKYSVKLALERYSKDPGSSPGGDTCFSLQ